MRILSATLLVFGLALAGAGALHAETPSRRSLMTIEGEVVAIASLPAEGALEVLTLSIRERGRKELRQILLAPARALEELGFTIAKGDQIRARIFKVDNGPARTQKIRVTNRGTMVRLRTLHELPLWSGDGSWQGGACRTIQGGGHHRRHGGHGGHGGGHR